MSNVTYETVTLGGKDRLLKFDVLAAFEIEEKFGKGLPAIMNEEQIGFRLIVTFYWAGLKWKEQGLTMQRVANMLNKEITENGVNFADLMKPVFNALNKSKLLSAPKDEFDPEDPNEIDNEDNPNE
jgi:hypothetical protein